MQKERLKKIYSDYLEIICPLIASHELLENKFPVGILNEIRALLTHIAKAESTDGETRDREIAKAESHVTRLQRDCYKYNCVALERKYVEYMKHLQANPVENLSILGLVKTHEAAIDALFVAKTLESSIESYSRETEIYENYKKAYDLYNEIRASVCTAIKATDC